MGSITNKLLIISALFLVTLNSWAQTFTIRITPDAGFETIDAIYNEFNTQQPQSILTILNEYPPESVDYLISNRPTGNLLNLMIASPNWAAAQLARMMVIEYPYPVDLTAVSENFENHPVIEQVGFDYTIDPINFVINSQQNMHQVTMELTFLPLLNCQFPSINAQGQTYDVQIQGNNINLYIVGTTPFSSTTTCSMDGFELTSYELGELHSGVYNINIYNASESTIFPVSNDFHNLKGQTTLVLRGSEPVSVPTLSFWFISALAVLVSLIGLRQAIKLNN